MEEFSHSPFTIYSLTANQKKLQLAQLEARRIYAPDTPTSHLACSISRIAQCNCAQDHAIAFVLNIIDPSLAGQSGAPARLLSIHGSMIDHSHTSIYDIDASVM